jgi:hypothetical protein
MAKQTMYIVIVAVLVLLVFWYIYKQKKQCEGMDYTMSLDGYLKNTPYPDPYLDARADFPQ